MITFRDTIRKVSPRWLQRGLAEKILYAIGVHWDLLVDMAADGVKRRFPGEAGNFDSLPIIGRERRIRRGPNEPDATYASRLPRWLDDHRTRGGPYAMLAQLHAFYAATPFAIELVYQHGTRFSLATNGTVARDAITWLPDGIPSVWDDPGFWDDDGVWDADSVRWAYWWLFYHWPTAVADDGTWDTVGFWNDGGTWDSTLTPDQVTELRVVPADWNAAHTRGTIVLLSPGAELWDYPTGTWDEPGGTWDSGLAVAKLIV